MGVTILFICLLVISAIIALVAMAFCKKYCKLEYDTRYVSGKEELNKKYDKIRDHSENAWWVGGIASVVMAIAVFIICISMVIIHAPSDQVNYKDMEREYISLKHRAELVCEDSSVTGNELFFDDALNFDKRVYSAKRYASNKWINWFNIEKNAEFDYVLDYYYQKVAEKEAADEKEV